MLPNRRSIHANCNGGMQQVSAAAKHPKERSQFRLASAFAVSAPFEFQYLIRTYGPDAGMSPRRCSSLFQRDDCRDAPRTYAFRLQFRGNSRFVDFLEVGLESDSGLFQHASSGGRFRREHHLGIHSQRHVQKHAKNCGNIMRNHRFSYGNSVFAHFIHALPIDVPSGKFFQQSWNIFPLGCQG